MAKDDYYVLIYKILTYLYECLKAGIKPDIEEISHNAPAINIKESYWKYIMVHLLDEGLIEGAQKVEIRGVAGIKIDPGLNITPLGIEYLKENSTIRKVEKILDSPVVKLAGGAIGLKL